MRSRNAEDAADGVTCPGRPGLKLVRVITRLNVGGPAVHVDVLTTELRRYGYETMLVAGACKPAHGDAAYPINPGRVTWIPEMARPISAWKDVRAVWHLYRLLRREKPQIVHTHTAKAGVVGRTAALLAGTPIIVHTYHGNSLTGYFSNRMSRVLRLIERSLAIITDSICVVSDQQAREIADHLSIAPRHKIRIVHLGVDLDDELSMPLPALEDGVLTVGWFGRLVEIKGIPLLAAVIEHALARLPAVRFVIAGDGPQRDVLVRLLTRVDASRVDFLGWQLDVRAPLRRCQLLMQTSRNEGTPLALIQGMAAGRPFIATDVGGLVDMTTGVARPRRGARWFDNGVLVDANPGAFVSALEAFCATPNPLATMSTHARRFAADRYRKTHMVETLDALYRQLVARAGGVGTRVSHGAPASRR